MHLAWPILKLWENFFLLRAIIHKLRAVRLLCPAAEYLIIIKPLSLTLLCASWHQQREQLLSCIFFPEVAKEAEIDVSVLISSVSASFSHSEVAAPDLSDSDRLRHTVREASMPGAHGGQGLHHGLKI